MDPRIWFQVLKWISLLAAIVVAVAWRPVMKRASRIAAIIVAVSVAGTWYFESQVQKQKDAETRELIEGKNELISQNKRLSEQIERYQADLRQKGEKIRQLQREANKLGRGISASYDFNGARRVTTRPGHTSVVAGEEVTVFQQMVALEQQKKYQELIRVCEVQIDRTPEWLTPYLFQGVAYANIGQRDKAIKRLKYVLDKAPDDPAYAQAKTLLEKLTNR